MICLGAISVAKTRAVQHRGEVMVRFARSSLLAWIVVGVTACGADVQFPGSDDQDGSSTTDCKSLVDSVFTSIADQSGGTRCGFDSRGNYACVDTAGAWLVQFDDENNVFWSTGESSNYGQYTCSDGTVKANLAAGSVSTSAVSGTIVGDILTWADLTYRRAD